MHIPQTHLSTVINEGDPVIHAPGAPRMHITVTLQLYVHHEKLGGGMFSLQT